MISLAQRLRSSLKLLAATSTAIPLQNPDGSVINLPLAVAGGAAGLMNGSQAFSANRWVIVGRGPWGNGSGIPNPATNTGNFFIATDIGVNANSFGGTLFTSDGTYWRPVNGRALLAANFSRIALTGSTVDTVLRQVTIPGKLMTPNSMLQITVMWSITNSANGKTVRVFYGGQEFAIRNLTNSSVWQNMHMIRNAGALNSQILYDPGSASVFAIGGTTTAFRNVDTAVDNVLDVRAMLANSTETVALDTFMVELVG